MELGARKALQCWKQRSKVHSGGSLKERNAESNTDTGGSAHEILGGKKDFLRGKKWSKEREDTHTHRRERKRDNRDDRDNREQTERQRGQAVRKGVDNRKSVLRARS